MENIVRMPEFLYDAVKAEVDLWAEQTLETFLFLSLTRIETPARRLYLARAATLLQEGEVVREAVRTYPTEAFCRRFYGTLREAGVFRDGARIAALHSHPFSRGAARFSEVDLASFLSDRKVFERGFGGVEFVGLVVDRDVSAFDGVLVGPDGLVPVDELQVVGRTLLKMRRAAREVTT